jgi:2-polyprenyl-3-methyl-5-hydroxy-6-metoxy-1,4-benzoquinol methylase
VSDHVGNLDLDALGVRPGDRVVDVGCGPGALAELLVREGMHVTGIEPAAYLRAEFERRVTPLDGDSHVLDGVAESLPLQPGSARAVVITEVLEHVADPAPVLDEIHRVLEPGGTVCVSVPTSFTERFYWRVHPRYATNATHVRIFTRDTLLTSLQGAGFEIARWEGRNFRPAVAWVFHALFRSPSDHAGVVQGNLWIERMVNAFFHALDLIRLGRLADALGNRVWPKSWYVYARRR